MEYLVCRAKNEEGTTTGCFTNRGEYTQEDIAILGQIAMAYAMDGREEFPTEVSVDNRVLFSYFDKPRNDFLFTITMAGNGNLGVYGVKEGSYTFEPSEEGIPLDTNTSDGMLRAIKKIHTYWKGNPKNRLNLLIITERELFERINRLQTFAGDFVIFVIG